LVCLVGIQEVLCGI